SDDSARESCAHRLRTRVNTEFFQYGGDVMVDGLRRTMQAPRELRVGASLGEQLQDFELAIRQAGGIGAGRFYGAARHVASPQLAQAPTDDRRHRARAQPVENGERFAEAFFRAFRKRQRLLVRHPDVLPHGARFLALAGKHQAPRLGDVGWNRGNRLGTRLPPEQLTLDPWSRVIAN